MRVFLYTGHRNRRPRYRGLLDYLRAKGHDAQWAFKCPANIGSYERVVTWHGLRPQDQRLRRRLRKSGSRLCYLETGFFSQRDHSLLSLTPPIGGGILEGVELRPLTDDQKEELKEKARQYSNGFEYSGDGNIIAGFLQVTKDYSITKHSPFKTMQQFVDRVEAMFPDDRVIFKAHPKQTPRVTTREPLYRGRSIWPLIGQAKFCIAANSSVLYEAAMAGCPVKALGNTPLNHNDPQAVVYEIFKRELPIGSADIHEQVTRSVGSFFDK